MRTKKVTRHYCDFCGRGYFHANRCKRHEDGCTANPKRVCNVCPAISEWQPEKFKNILDSITETNKDGILMALQLAANHCPACVFAALRQHPKTSEKLTAEDLKGGDYNPSAHVFVHYDIKKAWEVWKREEAVTEREWRYGTSAETLSIP